MANENNQNNNNSNKPRGNGLFTLLMLLMFLFFIVTFIIRVMNNNSGEEIKYSEFVDMLNEGTVEKIVIAPDRVNIYPVTENKNDLTTLFLGKEQSAIYTAKIEDDETITTRALAKGVTVTGEIPSNASEVWYFIFSYVLPIVLLLVFGIFIIRKMSSSGGGLGGIMNAGKMNPKVFVQRDTGKTFADVQGEDEAIESLYEVVDFLHNPDKYVKIGAKLPKGALLVGPPGTGKTLLAKAVAGEAKCPFFSLTGSDFVEMYVGVGASRVRDLFREAEKNAPCIIFIDEIDAIGRSRDSKMGGGNEEREQTLNQLLSEMDGFDGNKGIIVLAATNRPEILDKALLRPGRFDRRIIVEKPDLKGRVNILKVHAKDVLMDETVDFDEIALATSGAVGSDLANMINEAAINAVKEGREFVSQKDLFNAVEIVLVGKEKKDRVLSEKEKRIVAYHEVGHALISALQKNSEPVQKITIVPRTMGALGYVMHVPEEEKYLNSKEELQDMLVGLLGGRAAEEVVFKSVTTGASNDIEKATSIARSMITQYGMSEKFGLVGLETVESRYLDGRASLNCADKTAAAVDKEVMKILKDSYDEALRLLKKNRAIMDKLADFLIERETITGREFMEIYCAEKGIPLPEPKNPEDNKKNKNKEDKKPSVDMVVDDDTPHSEDLSSELPFGEPEDNFEEILNESSLSEATSEETTAEVSETEAVAEVESSEAAEELPEEASEAIEETEEAQANNEFKIAESDDEFVKALRNRIFQDNDDEDK